LPEEYEKCLVGLNAITKEAWNTGQNTEDKREKIQALSLAKECYSMKLDLLTNATVIDDAIRFVSHRPKDKEKLKSSAQDTEHNKDSSTSSCLTVNLFNRITGLTSSSNCVLIVTFSSISTIFTI
jgi:hypothetical protein